MKDKILI